MAPAAVATRFVPQLHSPSYVYIYKERGRRGVMKKKKKRQRWGIKGAKNSYSKTQIKLADIEKHM